MTKTESTLLELLKSALFGINATFDKDVDWNEVLKEAEAQTVVALVYNTLPDDVKGTWLIPSTKNKAHFVRALYEQTNIVTLLHEANIPFVIIKGTAAAIYYPDPSVRTMGDIDILVPEEFFDDAFSLLEKNGYKFCRDYGDKRDYSFTKGGVIFELHRRYSDENHDIEPYLINGIKNAETLTVYESNFPALPKAENGLVLLDHIRHHLFGGLGLRQINVQKVFRVADKGRLVRRTGRQNLRRTFRNCV